MGQEPHRVRAPEAEEAARTLSPADGTIRKSLTGLRGVGSPHWTISATGSSVRPLDAAVCQTSTPPAGPQWAIRLRPLQRQPLAYDKPLCASQDGFTLHAATRAGALDASGREALLRYVLRPPLAQDRIEQREDGLVRNVRVDGQAVLRRAARVRRRSRV